MQFMIEALKQAQLAFEIGEVPVGAVIVLDNEIVSKAHNLCISKKNSTMHAEIVAINQALDFIKKPFLENCDIYITLEPCHMCAGAIAASRFRRVFFGAYDVKSGGTEHGGRVFSHTLHKPEIIGGIMEKECTKLMQLFFNQLRN